MSNHSHWQIDVAQAYGGVLIDTTGQILLREPANHFDGYVWTFAKGKPDTGESPEETALREVREETGYQAEIIDVLPGIYHSGLSSSAFYVMRPLGEPQPFNWETQAICWVSVEEAEQRIAQTTNLKGRERDLNILVASIAWLKNSRNAKVLPNELRSHPATAQDWRILPMPPQHTTLKLDLTFSAQQAAQLAKGFIPTDMNEKWFSYFENNKLYQYRSWTGHCIDIIHFVADGEGLKATHAEVNRQPEQYNQTDDQVDIERITTILSQLANRG
jgi:8-oxo-dGTP pyrophosphatase MutT (NUDIX family)